MAGLEPAMRESKSLALPLGYTPVSKEGKGTGRSRSSGPSALRVGWVKGLEPSTPGTTIRCSNQLSYTHQIHGIQKNWENGTPEGIRTPGLLLRRQLLYPTELLAHIGAGDENRTRIPSLEGWCPGHCATPAYRTRPDRLTAANRQLVNNSTNWVICQYVYRNFLQRIRV